MDDNNIHVGHRDRLMEKFNKNPDVLNDHELLEAILFMAIPRVDTNPIAHRLLRAFGSLTAVFNATTNELCSVEGIGLGTASKIRLLGKVYERIYKEKVKSKRIYNRETLVEYIVSEFYNLKSERCVVYLINARYTIIHSLTYEAGEQTRVNAEPKEVLSAIGAHKPKFLLIAHNHPSGTLEPSVVDDYTTANFIKLCQLLEVEVIDHLIIADQEYYSYATSGHLEEVKSNPNFYKMRATGSSY